MPQSSETGTTNQMGAARHPSGLRVLFLTEMWERFSYYGMRALLILYLIDRFRFDEANAYILYGAYTSLVYITPLIGGILADRIIGYRKAIQLGAVLVTLGHAFLAAEGQIAERGSALVLFYSGLAFIIVGTGFIKANCAAMLGALYERDDARRDAGFTFYYIGINIGAALGALVAGWLGETYGWSWGFGAAGVGMAAGLVQFTTGTPRFNGAGEPPRPLPARREWLVYGGALAAVPLFWLLLGSEVLVQYLLGAAGAAIVAYVIWVALSQSDARERRGMLGAGLLIVISVFFWALYEQAGSSLNVFTDRRIDRHLLGWEVPAPMFQALNSIYILLLAPLFALLWSSLARAGREPSVATKFGLGLVQLGGGFLVLVLGVEASGDALVPLSFIALLYLLHSTGELCLVPVGISAVTRLAVPHMVGFIVGAWAFANAAGSFVAGYIAAATAIDSGGVDSVAPVYRTIGWAGVAAGVVVIVGGVIVTATRARRRAQP